VSAEPTEASACHCSQCRRQSGNYWASANVPATALEITGEPRWFHATPDGPPRLLPDLRVLPLLAGHGEDTIAFALGALDAPTGLRLERHIFTGSKGDWYDIADDLPQRP
jgi:hypothetical protein